MIEDLPLVAFSVLFASVFLVLTAMLVAWGVRGVYRILGQPLPPPRGRHSTRHRPSDKPTTMFRSDSASWDGWNESDLHPRP